MRNTLCACALLAAACGGDVRAPDLAPRHDATVDELPGDAPVDVPAGLDRDAVWADVVAELEAFLPAYGIPGLSVAVAIDGEVRYAAGLGRRDDEGTPVTTATLFRPGSVQKMVTSAAVLTLVDDGLIDLDEPVQGLVPSFTAVSADGSTDDAAAVTMRMLLTHTSGLADGGELLCADVADSAAQWFAWDQELWSPPGRLFNYSNLGYALAGHALASVDGSTYLEAMQARVLGPAGMDSVVFRPADVVATGDYATGYVSSAGALTSVAPAETDCAWIRPAGFWWATASDVARFGALLADDGGDVLSPASTALLTSPLVPTGANEPYGLGVAVWSEHAGRRLLHHGGALNGFSAFLAVAPDDDVSVAVLWNLDGMDASGTTIWIMNKMLGLPDWVDTPYDVPAPPPSTYGRYSGTFTDPSWLGEVNVRVDGSRLLAEFVDYGTTAELSFPIEDTFAVDLPADADPALPAAVTFFFDDAGGVEYFASRWGVARVALNP